MIQEFANIGDAPVSQIMQKGFFNVRPNFTIRSTIEVFQMHKMSCAPVTDDQSSLIGIISEHDLLIQAASKPMSSPISYSSKVTSVYSDTKIKDVLVIFFTKKLKYIPVIDRTEHIRGMVSRIDLLNYLAKNSP